MSELSDREVAERVGRSLRRGNINFDFLNPVQPGTESIPIPNDRRGSERAGKRGLFNRGRKPKVMRGWHTWLSFSGTAVSLAGLVLVWNSQHFLAMLAVPFLLSSALVSLIMLGLFLARPR